MRNALYFPHTEVGSKNLVRTALLTWDRLEYIVPDRQYQPTYRDRTIARAMEIVGERRVPDAHEKERVHELVMELVEAGAPETFLYSPRGGERDEAYEIWPQKLAPKTWNLLRDAGLTDRPLDNHDYPMRQAAGLSLMAILADVLAGDRTRVTDRGLAYATIANAPGMVARANDGATVVALTFKGIAIDQIPFDRLIEFREREAKESGRGYRELRHKYLEAVEAHLKRIAHVRPGSKDRLDLDSAFESDMEDDLSDLKRELGFAKRDVWLSREVMALGLAATALTTALAAPQFLMPEVIAGSGGAVLLGGLLGTGNKLAKARYETLRKHPMAYLYEIGT